jgi:signal transduction histidine kinase
MEYQWRNPGEENDRDKAMYLSHFEPWQWIIAVSSYRDEFLELIDVNDFKENILSIKLEQTGYCFVLDSAGNAIVHGIDAGRKERADAAGRVHDLDGRAVIR